MKIRMLRMVILFCLGLPGVSIGATDAAQNDELKTTETGGAGASESDAAEAGESDAAEAGESDAAEAGESDAAEAGESDAAEAGESDAAEAEDGGGGGILSTILQWFQGRNLDTDSEGEQAQGRQQGREADGKEVTLSHVYQAIRNLIAEIEILRQATGVADAPPEADPREDQAPIHAYSKSLEVMEKTARIQKRLGMIPVEVGPIPVKRITPQDVHRNVQAIIEELRRVKRQLVIEDEIQPAPFAGGKTPSLLYKKLGDASFLLDGLVGRPTTSNDAYMHVLRVHDEMELIAAKLGVALESDPLMVESKKEPKEVAQQILRARYKAINLQSRLGMDASSVPNPTLVQVTPAEVFDSTNILLAEMARVKVHLNIRLPPAERRESRNKQPKDVFAQVLLVIKNLDILTEAADNAS